MIGIPMIGGRATARGLLALALAASAVAPAAEPAATTAAERLGRQISDIPGMPPGIEDVAQDSTGYLWLAGIAGLHRYDGYEVRSWCDDANRSWMKYVSAGPGDRIAAGHSVSGLFEVDGESIRRLPPPGDGFAPGPHHAVFDRDGVLWAAWNGRVVRRDVEADRETWTTVDARDLDEAYAWRLEPRAAGGLLVGTLRGAVFIVEADGRARRLIDGLGGRVTRLVDEPEGPIVIVRGIGRSGTARPGIVRLEEDGPVLLLEYSSRSEALLRRGSTIWASFGTGVWAIGDDGSREFLTARHGMTGSGTIRLDREGGLWMTGSRGLAHFPEPDTRVHTEKTSLPHSYLRAIYEIPGGFAVTTWRGALLLDEDGTYRGAIDLGGLFTRDLGCVDPWGSLWLKTYDADTDGRTADGRHPGEVLLVAWRDGRRSIRARSPWWSGNLSCDTAPDGAFWVLAGRSLWRVAADGRRPAERGVVPARFAAGRTTTAFLIHDATGDAVAAFDDGLVCTAPLAADGASVSDETWTCAQAGVAGSITDLAETPGGKIWLASTGGGISERVDGTWRAVGRDLAHLHSILGIDRSPSGGQWVLGWRERLRVEETDSGPVVVERLGTAHGVPEWQNGYGLLERHDGTIWLPLYSGLVEIPAAARRAAVEPPTVTLTSLVADGRRVNADAPIQLRHGDHWLEARWSALSFRDPARVRYRMRLGADEPWRELDQPFVRLAGLGAGRHRLELSASVDGRAWSETPAAVAFDVRRAWYARSSTVAAALILLLAATYVVFRLRLAHLLRLERQRTRIAMDLHDEMGAGLGSAGLLVGLLGDESLPSDERRKLAARTERTIRDLGSALADIVWSLRPGAGTLDALVLFLRQRAADLFPAGSGVKLTVDAPDPCPRAELALAVRRNLQWIAVEALHNAARHSEATAVALTLRPDGEAWVLSVRDNGRGIAEDEADVRPAGLGRESMTRRARQIGARLEVTTAPGEGTEVAVRFRPARPGRR